MKNHSRTFTFTIIAVLLLSGFAALVAVVPNSPLGTVSATIDPTKASYCWDGEGANALASNAVNWRLNNLDGSTTNDAALSANFNYVFNATSTKACTWDIDDSTLTVYSFNINIGYSSTVTQAATADIGIGEGGLSQAAGTLTGNNGKDVICAGDVNISAGAITGEVLRIDMTGESKNFSTVSNGFPLRLKFSNNTNILSDTWAYNINITAGKTVNIASGKYLRCVLYDDTTFGSWSNSGIINGPGILEFDLVTADQTIEVGTVNAPVQIVARDDASANRTASLGASTIIGGALTVISQNTAKTMTVDMGGKTLSATAITVGTRGGLLGGEGDITTASWDSSAGTWTPETSNVHFTGTGTVKSAAGQTFYNLTVGAGASVTQSSNVVVSEWMELDGGAWAKGAYTLTAPLMTLSSTITATGTEDVAYSYAPIADQPISSVSVVTNGTWLSIVGTSVVGTPTNAEVGTFYVNVTCTNVIGSVSQNSTITISNTAPVWTSAPSTEWSYGMTYSYDPSASDEGAGLVYSMTSSAIELRCDPASGAIRGKVMDNSITVSLMADDGNGGVIYQNWTITAIGFSWDGDVMVNYTEGQNLKITFSASLTNATYNSIIKSVQWNFGDGNGSRVLDLMPMHPYERAGTYTVTCYIVTEDDMTATKNIQITVGDPAVVEDLENQYAERMNQAVLISGLACAAGLVIIACYIKIAGRRGWINRLVPIMILVAMLAISATLIGSAMQ